MSYKVITFRANEEDLNMLSDLMNWTEKIWKDSGVFRKPTMTDVIFHAIINDWQNKCLPFNEEEKPYKFRAEKDIPYN